MTSSVAIVTDSAASLPAELAQQWGVRVVPLQVIVDGVAHAEGAGIPPEQVLRDLESGAVVTTSQPSPAAFEQAYRHAARAGATEVVAVLLSGKLSGTVEAASQAGRVAGIRVIVVDTQTVAMGTGFAAIAAASLARSGANAEAVAEEARRVAASTVCVFTVDTLEYLRKGGRISPAVAAAGKVLGVRPILEVADGEVVLGARVRTTARARDALMKRASEAIAGLERPAVAVLTLGATDVADAAASALAAAHPNLALTVRAPLSAVLSAHAGPGAIAVVTVDLPAHVH